MVIGSDMGEKQHIKYRDYLQHISVLCSQRNDFFTQLVLSSKKITQ